MFISNRKRKAERDIILQVHSDNMKNPISGEHYTGSTTDVKWWQESVSHLSCDFDS